MKLFCYDILGTDGKASTSEQVVIPDGLTVREERAFMSEVVREKKRFLERLGLCIGNQTIKVEENLL